MRKDATQFNDTLLVAGDARSAFASFGYYLCTGQIDLTGSLPANQIAALRKAYIEAFWFGKFENFGVDTEGYLL